MDTTSVLVTSALSAIIGFGSAHLVAKNILVKTKIQKVLSFVLLISIGVGITGTLNELMNSYFSATPLRTDKVVMFVFSNIFFIPLVLYFSIFISRKIASNNSNNSVQINNESTLDKNTISKSFFNKPLNSQNLITIFTLILILGLGFSIGSSKFSFLSNNEFKLSSCTVCGPNSGCQDIEIFKGFKVLDDSIQLFFIDTNKISRISTLPISSEMKCSIVRNHNFAFDCNYHNSEGGLTSISSYTFDGKDKFIFNTLHMSSVNGKVFVNSKTTCSVD